MGIVGRIIGWVWRRFADYNTLIALLDLIDAKTIVPIVAAWIGMMFFGATNTEWSAPGVVVAACVVGACVGIIVIAVRFVISRGSPVQPAKQDAIISHSTLVQEPIPDIDAREAFFQILDRSEWRAKQFENPPDPKTTRHDWLKIRLQTEIHNYLAQDRLTAWGETSLPRGTGPQRKIKPEEWETSEILFDELNPAVPRTMAKWRRNDRGSLFGIMFSRAQIFKLFPLAGSNEWKPIHLAIKHISERIGDMDSQKCFPTGLHPVWLTPA